MTRMLSRRVLAAGATLSLALPGTALAAHHGLGHHRHAAVRGAYACQALRDGKTPKKLTADQVTKIVAACDTRDAALKSARDTFRTTVDAARATFRASAKADTDRHALRSAVRNARKARNAAVHAARKAFRQQVRAILRG